MWKLIGALFILWMIVDSWETGSTMSQGIPFVLIIFFIIWRINRWINS